MYTLCVCQNSTSENFDSKYISHRGLCQGIVSARQILTIVDGENRLQFLHERKLERTGIVEDHL